MPFALTLPAVWAARGWKAKIREDEHTEEPHVTIVFKMWTWRVSLRSGEFMDPEPLPRLVPGELVDLVWSQRGLLRTTWDEMYPENVVFSKEER